jgi:hypothetical protein
MFSDTWLLFLQPWPQNNTQLYVHRIQSLNREIQFNSFIFLHKHVKIIQSNIMIKITSMEKKGIQN